MAWEDRNSRKYYYRKRREGKHVISEYGGSGLAGELAEIFDVEDRQETQQKHVVFQGQKANVNVIDNHLVEIEKLTRAITRAVLLVSGYHPHKRQWRKRRDVR